MGEINSRRHGVWTGVEIVPCRRKAITKIRQPREGLMWALENQIDESSQIIPMSAEVRKDLWLLRTFSTLIQHSSYEHPHIALLLAFRARQHVVFDFIRWQSYASTDCLFTLSSMKLKLQLVLASAAINMFNLNFYCNYVFSPLFILAVYLFILYYLWEKIYLQFV